MTLSDLIVAAPWIAFAVALAIVGFLALREGRASRTGRGAAGAAGARDQQPRRRLQPGRSRRCRERPTHVPDGRTEQGNRARVAGDQRAGDGRGHDAADGMQPAARDDHRDGDERRQALPGTCI